MNPRPPMARLDRLLANLGYGSRREVSALVREGRVVLDGVVLKDAGTKVPVSAALPTQLMISGAPVDPPAPLTLVMHKPLGVVCSHRETGRSVYELLPKRWPSSGILSDGVYLTANTSEFLSQGSESSLLRRQNLTASCIPARHTRILNTNRLFSPCQST